MSHSKVTVKDADLSKALATAVADLLHVDDVSLDLEVPGDLHITDVKVKLSATVTDGDQGDQGIAQAPAERRAEASPEPTSENQQEDVDDAADVAEGEEAVDEVDHGDQLDREVDAAADFVEGLLDALDLAGELELRLNDEEQSAEVEVVNMDSGALIGRRGSTLEAVQELMRCALQSQFERRVRITVDVEGYRARRLEKLLDKADEAIDEVLDTGESVRLEPMDVFERKAVHELVGTVDGVLSRSQGREPSRRVVIEPTDD
jgi:spoIIIJ-associated protein